MTKQDFLREIRDMHRYLEDWLKGIVPRGNGKPSRLIDALTDDFIVIHPNGTIGRKPDVIGAFAGAYGEKPAEYALEVDMVETRMIEKNLCLATYVEDHAGESGRRRRSSAVLRRRSENGFIEWLFLQETAITDLPARDPKG